MTFSKREEAVRALNATDTELELDGRQVFKTKARDPTVTVLENSLNFGLWKTSLKMKLFLKST